LSRLRAIAYLDSSLGRDPSAGDGPAIHALLGKKGVDARNKCGHDAEKAV
jgi:hypothetical protein